jgi:PAS domain-containing protein
LRSIGLANREGGYTQAELEMAEALASAIVQAYFSKRTEAALHQAQESLQLALEAAQMGARDLDLSTNQARSNLRHSQIFGYTEAVVRWNPEIFLDQHVLPEDRTKFQAAYTRALETGDLVQGGLNNPAILSTIMSKE